MITSTEALNAAETAIANEIINHASREGSPKSSWYAGIAAKPTNRLFIDHRVSEKGGWWIYNNAGSEESARKIEMHLINVHGFAGGPGGGDYDTTYIYAYRKTQDTIE